MIRRAHHGLFDIANEFRQMAASESGYATVDFIGPIAPAGLLILVAPTHMTEFFDVIDEADKAPEDRYPARIAKLEAELVETKAKLAELQQFPLAVR